MNPELPEGGPAFPVQAKFSTPAWNGMSLRDWFAGQALAGLLACPVTFGSEEELVDLSWKYSDLMLKQRLHELNPA